MTRCRWEGLIATGTVVWVRAATAALACALLAGCSWFGGGGGTPSTSVFSVRPGQCFTAQSQVRAELSSLHRTPCTGPHAQEAYALVAYGQSGAQAGANYPGSDVLTKFAQGACAQRFGAYVGTDYLDSHLFFTYLLPSPRSWQQDGDRNVICFITSAGTPLTASAKNSKQ